jgi:hypothetical protein
VTLENPSSRSARHDREQRYMRGQQNTIFTCQISHPQDEENRATSSSVTSEEKICRRKFQKDFLHRFSKLGEVLSLDLSQAREIGQNSQQEF